MMLRLGALAIIASVAWSSGAWACPPKQVISAAWIPAVDDTMDLAKNCYGAAAPPPPPPPPPPNTVKIDDTDNSIIFSSPASTVGSSWGSSHNDTNDFNTSEHFNNFCHSPVEAVPVQGAMVVETFNGTDIAVIGKKGSVLGIGAFAIDGGALTLKDQFDTASSVYQQNLFTASGLSAGSHVISYQVTCNTSGSGTYQVIDAYLITGTPLPVSSATQADFAHTTHSAGWQSGTGNATDLSGSHAWSGTAGDTITWTFSGTLIEVFGRPDIGDGLFNVIIDGVTVATNVDGHYGGPDNDALTGYMLYAKKLSGAGPHTITLHVNGTSDSIGGSEAGSGLQNLLQFDEFLAYP